MVGETKLQNQDGAGLINHVAFEVDAGKTVFSADHPNVTAFPKVASSSSPDVAKFVRSVAHNLEETARWVAGRNRPALPQPKPKEIEQRIVDLPDRLPVACPACGGEGYFLCDLCDGEGRVPRYRAEEWRDRFDVRRSS
jgi:hypothetical protein